MQKNMIVCIHVFVGSLLPHGQLPAADVRSTYRADYMKQYIERRKSIPRVSVVSDYEVLFFDLDGDGAEEALIASSAARDRDGNGWAATRRNSETGRIESHPSPEIIESGIHVSSRTSELFIVSLDGARDCLYVDNALICELKDFGARYGTQRHYHDDVFLTMDDKGFLKAESVRNGFFGIVSNPAFRHIDHAATEMYSDADAKLMNGNPAAVDIVLAKPKDFGAFVVKYREEVKSRLKIDRKVTVYAVFFDADNDGDADFYVTSDAEGRPNGQYEWHLYLDDGGKFSKSEKAVWFNKDKPRNRESVEPDETAGRDSFYSVQRSFGFSPSVVILDRDDDTFHSRTHRRQIKSPPPTPPARHLSYEQEREYYPEFEEWKWEQKAKLGFEPACDFTEIVLNYDFLRLERLKCETFAEIGEPLTFRSEDAIILQTKALKP